MTFLSSKLTFLSSKLTFLSSKLTFLSSKLTFLSSKLTFRDRFPLHADTPPCRIHTALRSIRMVCLSQGGRGVCTYHGHSGAGESYISALGCHLNGTWFSTREEGERTKLTFLSLQLTFLSLQLIFLSP